MAYGTVVTVGMALFLFQQFAGINAVVYFSTNVFRSAGIASDVAASALVGAANVIGTTVASSLMDKQGRKKLLMGSFSGMVCWSESSNIMESGTSFAFYMLTVIKFKRKSMIVLHRFGWLRVWIRNAVTSVCQYTLPPINKISNSSL